MQQHCQAAENGHKESVALLLERGAEIEGKDNDGLTALHWARRSHVACFHVT